MLVAVSYRYPIRVPLQDHFVVEVISNDSSKENINIEDSDVG